MHDRPYNVGLNEILEAKSLFLSIHPSERNERLQLSLFTAFSRVIVGSIRKFIRLRAQKERDSLPWTFRETLIPPASAKEN